MSVRVRSLSFLCTSRWPPEAVDTTGAPEWADAYADGTTVRAGPATAGTRQEGRTSSSSGMNGKDGSAAQGVKGSGPGDVQASRQLAAVNPRQDVAVAQGPSSSAAAAVAAASPPASISAPVVERTKPAVSDAGSDAQGASTLPSEGGRGESGAMNDVRRERARRRAERKAQQEEFKQPFRGIEHSEAHVIMVLRAAATAQAAAAEAAEAASHAATAAADAMAASARCAHSARKRVSQLPNLMSLCVYWLE